MQVKINDVLYKQISEYCSLNNLKIYQYVNELLDRSFKAEKFGLKPQIGVKPKKNEEENKPNVFVVENSIEEKKQDIVPVYDNKKDDNDDINVLIIDNKKEDKPKKRKLK